MGSEDNGAHDAILDAINGLRADVREVREEQRRVQDQLAGYHGDTVGTAECAKCSEKWLDKRSFIAGLTVIGVIEPGVMWLASQLLGHVLSGG